MRLPMLSRSLKWPLHDEDEIDAVIRVLRSGKTNYWTGQHSRTFEKEYAEFTGAPHAVALMNGTVALEAALYALDIGPGDEVITSCRTFIASASSIVMRGATPVLADIDRDSQNITPETITPCLTPRTKAIIVVHLAGWPADMEGILALARQHHLKVIEDCAQAHGAMIHGQKVGTFGEIGAFSFCQDKILTTGGEGGMIITHDPALWEKIWSFKDHGKSHEKISRTDHPPGFRWLHDSFGTNWRMTEMQSAIGRTQLRKLPEWLRIRARNASILTECLQGHPSLRLPDPPPHLTHAWYKYYLFVRPETLRQGWSRDRILKEATDKGIPCFSGSCSEIYLEQAFEKALLQPRERHSVAKELGETSMMFLVDPSWSENDIREVAQAFLSVIESAVV